MKGCLQYLITNTNRVLYVTLSLENLCVPPNSPRMSPAFTNSWP